MLHSSGPASENQIASIYSNPQALTSYCTCFCHFNMCQLLRVALQLLKHNTLQLLPRGRLLSHYLGATSYYLYPFLPSSSKSKYRFDILGTIYSIIGECIWYLYLLFYDLKVVVEFRVRSIGRVRRVQQGEK